MGSNPGPKLNSAQSVQSFGNYLFVAYPDRLLRSTDGGLNWSFLDFRKKYNQLGRGIIRFFFFPLLDKGGSAQKMEFEGTKMEEKLGKGNGSPCNGLEKTGECYLDGYQLPCQSMARKEEGNPGNCAEMDLLSLTQLYFWGDSTGVGIAKEGRHKGILVVSKDGGCTWKKKGIAVEGLFWPPSLCK